MSYVCGSAVGVTTWLPLTAVDDVQPAEQDVAPAQGSFHDRVVLPPHWYGFGEAERAGHMFTL